MSILWVCPGPVSEPILTWASLTPVWLASHSLLAVRWGWLSFPQLVILSPQQCLDGWQIHSLNVFAWLNGWISCTAQYCVFTAGTLAMETSNNNYCEAKMIIAHRRMKGVEQELQQLLVLSSLFEQQKQLTNYQNSCRIRRIFPASLMGTFVVWICIICDAKPVVISFSATFSLFSK